MPRYEYRLVDDTNEPRNACQHYTLDSARRHVEVYRGNRVSRGAPDRLRLRIQRRPIGAWEHVEAHVIEAAGSSTSTDTRG